MENALCLMTPWSQQCKQRKDLAAHSGEVEWTLDRATFAPEGGADGDTGGHIAVDNVLKKSCHLASNRINCRLVTSWDDVLAYPMLKVRPYFETVFC